MKTLLTEKENLEIHKDKVSARCNVFLGDIRKVKGFGYAKLVEKLIFRINTCPHCKSTNSFHRHVNDPANPNRNAIDNVYREYCVKKDDFMFYHKIDYCLDCHKEFSIEMYGWKKLSKEELKAYKAEQHKKYWADFWDKYGEITANQAFQNQNL